MKQRAFAAIFGAILLASCDPSVTSSNTTPAQNGYTPEIRSAFMTGCTEGASEGPVPKGFQDEFCTCAYRNISTRVPAQKYIDDIFTYRGNYVTREPYNGIIEQCVNEYFEG